MDSKKWLLAWLGIALTGCGGGNDETALEAQGARNPAFVGAQQGTSRSGTAGWGGREGGGEPPETGETRPNPSGTEAGGESTTEIPEEGSPGRTDSESGTPAEGSEGVSSGSEDGESSAEGGEAGGNEDGGEGGTCTPQCDGVCGSDGCGGSCGTCPPGEVCDAGKCVQPGCGQDPCDPANQITLPPLCGTTLECSQDSDCFSLNSWSAEYHCESGTCVFSVRACEEDAECLAHCDAFYAALGTDDYGYCASQKWRCNPANDCPNAPGICSFTPKCGPEFENAICLSDWNFEASCIGGVCEKEVRHCQDGTECYDWCREFYAETYAVSPGFSYCEDQAWVCENAAGCADQPKACAAFAPCTVSEDCPGSWIQSYACEAGVCRPSWLECTTPSQCYDACLEVYETVYNSGVDWSWCEDQTWACIEY